MPPASLMDASGKPRHHALVRVTHWVTTLCFLALLVSGLELVVSHPRFYWGETGTSNMTPAFQLPIPSSRDTVPTGYKFVLPDQNGWSRSMHFQAAWALLIAGLLYGIYGIWSGHFRRDLVPARGDRGWGAYRDVVAGYLQRRKADPGAAGSYNALQRVAYLAVLFFLFPVMIWTGLAMSPAFAAVMPWSVTLLGGRQSARTEHFIVTWLLVLFVVVHVAMVVHAGFRARMKAMTIGERDSQAEEAGLEEPA